MIAKELAKILEVRVDNSSHNLHYEEAVFTTMRMIAGSVQEWGAHFERLRQGIDFISGPKSDSIWSDIELDLLKKLSNFTGNQVLRLSIIIEDLKVTITPRPLPEEYSTPIKLRSVKQKGRPDTWPSFLKSEINLDAKKRYLQVGDDELLFLNEDDIIQESTIANIFVVRDNILLTPKLGPNVLDGIVRRKILDMAPCFFNSVIENDIYFNNNFKAEAIFLTNSVRGVFLVDRIDQFEITYTSDLFKKLAEIKELVMK